jgi:hypothetical protein
VDLIEAIDLEEDNKNAYESDVSIDFEVWLLVCHHNLYILLLYLFTVCLIFLRSIKFVNIGNFSIEK